MCDSHYRTITGLESLVQKEWVAMGHPFTSRSGLVTEGSTEDDEGKVSCYTLSPLIVTEFAVTFSHKIVLLKYMYMYMYMYLWLLNSIVNLQVHLHVYMYKYKCTYGIYMHLNSSIVLSIYMYMYMCTCTCTQLYYNPQGVYK